MSSQADENDEKTDETSNSSLFSTSILRPSVLPEGLRLSDVKIKNSDIDSQAKPGKSPVETPNFTPETPASLPTEPASAPGFVFGQNMSSRVINANEGVSRNLWQTFRSDGQGNE